MCESACAKLYSKAALVDLARSLPDSSPTSLPATCITKGYLAEPSSQINVPVPHFDGSRSTVSSNVPRQYCGLVHVATSFTAVHTSTYSRIGSSAPNPHNLPGRPRIFCPAPASFGMNKADRHWPAVTASSTPPIESKTTCARTAM